MNILILGYGKMGKTIERISIERGHNIVDKIDVHNQDQLKSIKSDEVDVAIEFSQPDVAYQNIATCLETGIAVISGTTGWLQRKDDIEKICKDNDGTFFYASNFSIGVNVFFRINKYLADIMNEYAEYDPSIIEVHHAEKKDAPSGTAITLAEGIIDNITRLKKWENRKETKKDVLGIESERTGNVPGTHLIKYRSNIEEIAIRHEAFGREGFAQGAILVSEWLRDKKGILGMDDFLDI
ncbi:4-hydroxy-tetrahydrodipicolinate reductase [Bacteroidota bacterium]